VNRTAPLLSGTGTGMAHNHAARRPARPADDGAACDIQLKTSVHYQGMEGALHEDAVRLYISRTLACRGRAFAHDLLSGRCGLPAACEGLFRRQATLCRRCASLQP
jgi:hypothetical protein